jgi:hypothetical protein
MQKMGVTMHINQVTEKQELGIQKLCITQITSHATPSLAFSHAHD